MSSHVLSEVGLVCDRIALLRKGELALLSTVEEIRRLAARRVRVFFAEDVSLPPDLPPGSVIVESSSRVWNVQVQGVLGPLLRWIAELPVRDIEVEEPRLEDVVRKYYRDPAQ